MLIVCSVIGHVPVATRHCNQGLEFSLCHYCGCDLIRDLEGGEWAQVPAGFRVVWREFGREGDAAAVAQRMATMAPPPRRRGPRNARPAPRRDPRGRPIKGMTAMMGTLASLARLVGDDSPDSAAADPGPGGVICLPGNGAT